MHKNKENLYLSFRQHDDLQKVVRHEMERKSIPTSVMNAGRKGYLWEITAQKGKLIESRKNIRLFIAFCWKKTFSESEADIQQTLR